MNLITLSDGTILNLDHMMSIPPVSIEKKLASTPIKMSDGSIFYVDWKNACRIIESLPKSIDHPKERERDGNDGKRTH